ncbi:MAG: ankyrin repeat domain-containing protein [Verrucomicrobia bacterium]|nr:ankyrin repeat domain-containing protein [Verrucomicrobiota bacterium]
MPFLLPWRSRWSPWQRRFWVLLLAVAVVTEAADWFAGCRSWAGEGTIVPSRQTARKPPVSDTEAPPPTLADGRTYQPAEAAEARELQRLIALLKDSPDLVNGPGFDGRTPLQAAAENGQLAAAELILDHGAKPDGTGAPGQLTPLLLAAEHGHPAVVELLLAHHADMNVAIDVNTNRNPSLVVAPNTLGRALSGPWGVPLWDGFTPLHVAADLGFKGVVEVLLAHGARANVGDTNRSTPLHLAAARGFRAIAQELLTHGADVNARDTGGATPLFYAVDKDFVETARLLLAKGADPNAAGAFRSRKRGISPLLLAAEGGDLEMARLLLDHGAKVNLQGWEGQTPLIASVSFSKSLALAKLLVERGADVNVRDNLGTPLFYVGLLQEPLAFAELLLAHGADPNLRDNYGSTVLADAAAAGSSNLVQLLLDHGANPNVKSYLGATALTRAAEQDRLGIARLLLAHRANVDTPDRNGWTPLFHAVKNQDSELVGLLLAHGAEVRVRDYHGLSLLHVLESGPNPATRRGDRVVTAERHKALFALLVERGVDVNAQTSDGKTVLCDVVERGSVGLAGLLLEHQANPNILYRIWGNVPPSKGERPREETATPLAVAAKSLRLDLARLLLEHGADPDVEVTLWGRGRWTPLALVIEPNVGWLNLNFSSDVRWGMRHQVALDLAKLLLRFKANVNATIGIERAAAAGARLPAPQTAPLLNLAVERREVGMVRLLLASQAEVNATDGLGRTALHCAAGGQGLSGDPNLATLLLARGADVNARANDGSTPLLDALHSPQPTLVKLLLEHGANINARDDQGRTALFRAVSAADPQMVRLLLAYRPEVNIAAQPADWEPGSLLQVAEAMAAGSVPWEYDYGAFSKTSSTSGISPAQWCREQGYDYDRTVKRVETAGATIVELLRQHGAWDGPVAVFQGEVQQTLLRLPAGRRIRLSWAVKQVKPTPDADLTHIRLTRGNPRTETNATETVSLEETPAGRSARKDWLAAGNSVFVPTRAGTGTAVAERGRGRRPQRSIPGARLARGPQLGTPEDGQFDLAVLRRRLPETITLLTASERDRREPRSYEFPRPNGIHVWKRIDADTWHEVFPDGAFSVFKVLGHAKVGETEGTIIVKVAGDFAVTGTPNDGNLQAFIPDKGSARMHHWYRNISQGDMRWHDFAEMQNIR